MLFHDISISSEAVKPYFYVGLTLLSAVIIDNILRSFIKVPKPFDNRRSRNIVAFTKNFITIGVYAVAVYTILSILGVNVAPLLASASIIGIVIGIGARSTIEDFATGLFFLSFDSMTIGDFVKIGEAEGYVDKISSRTLTIRTLDGALHIFPNSQVKGLANFSRNKANVMIDLPIKSNQEISKILKAAEVALEQLKTDEKSKDFVLPDSKINGIEDFRQPEIMVLRITVVTYPVRRWEIGRMYRLLAKKEFEKHKILFA